MKIHYANYDPTRLGGGWSFTRALASQIPPEPYETADVYFIPGASMVERADVIRAKADGKKIVLRVDNAIRNSRNRNTGMTRMYDFAQLADQVIYQSEWCREYLRPFLGKNGVVIGNGIDLEHFIVQGINSDTILYSRYSRDDTKNYEVARYWFTRYQQQHPSAKLYIVGNFGDDIRQGNFDFYAGERFHYIGVVGYDEMPSIYGMASKFLYTYYNDCYSNTLIEALCSGLEIVGDEYYRGTGGAKEIMETFNKYGREAFSHVLMGERYREVFESL